ncbi:hypothetical protein [Streptomyces sp. NPDC047014]|uniref:hypothetical protein n=1 Tax=Streptomyces sp. NPDC047014 TaxID=3155736 RepID=UPI0033F7ADEC
MSFADLTLGHWQALDPEAARRIARELAGAVGGRLSGFGTGRQQGGGGTVHRVRVERDGQEFGLVPGGTVRVGFDLDAWRPTPAQEADYAASAEQGFGHAPDLRGHLALVLSPRRTVTLPALLVAVADEELTDVPAAMPAVLAARGLRMPSPDEWEYACGAGAGTLFRWGDACPLDRPPYGDRGGPRHEPSLFGLRIAYDTYRTELTDDPAAVHGGDGGESVCGGYGNLLGWLPLATAHRNPYLAEFVHGPDGEGLCEDFSTRPVLPL